MSVPLKVIHCLRAPVGGLFRHVCDLARGQSSHGIDVGVICDAHKGERLYEDALNELNQHCTLGVHRVAMHRSIAPSDIAAGLAVRSLCRDLEADIIHGHGAKGGAYARYAALGSRQKVFYTPHGGSLHYSASSLSGFVFLTLERLLGRWTDGLIFESRYGLETYRAKVGTPSCAMRVIHNGVEQNEFDQVPVNDDAAEFLFIGELRMLKGIEPLLKALSMFRAFPNASAVIVGSGPDELLFRNLVESLGLSERVSFRKPMPARSAFALGHVLVVPSLAESFPYIVLESLAAAKPTLATRVGGIPEMFEGFESHLLPPGDETRLAAAMEDVLAAPEATLERSRALQRLLQSRFTADRMVDAISQFYSECRGTSKGAADPISGHRYSPK